MDDARVRGPNDFRWNESDPFVVGALFFCWNCRAGEVYKIMRMGDDFWFQCCCRAEFDMTAAGFSRARPLPAGQKNAEDFIRRFTVDERA